MARSARRSNGITRIQVRNQEGATIHGLPLLYLSSILRFNS